MVDLSLLQRGGREDFASGDFFTDICKRDIQQIFSALFTKEGEQEKETK
nr:hypothetical protein [Haemophilus parahaemolyticus]